VEEGKEGEHCSRRVPVQENQVQEHQQPEVEPIRCNCNASAAYREQFNNHAAPGQFMRRQGVEGVSQAALKNGLYN
jgi:hypothetical protein